MSSNTHHEGLVNGFYNQLKQIFDESPQAIYLYLDDNHKVCNKNFASLLGYTSPEEWAKIENPLEENVDKSSQDAVVSAYFNASEKMIGSQMDVRLRTTTGNVLDASVIVVPVAYMNHMFALYILSKKQIGEWVEKVWIIELLLWLVAGWLWLFFLRFTCGFLPTKSVTFCSAFFFPWGYWFSLH